MVKRKNTGTGNTAKKLKSVSTRKTSNKNKLSTESERCMTSSEQNFDLISWVRIILLFNSLIVFYVSAPYYNT